MAISAWDMYYVRKAEVKRKNYMRTRACILRLAASEEGDLGYITSIVSAYALAHN